MMREILQDKISSRYEPGYLPGLLRQQPIPLRIVLFNTTGEESKAPVQNWLYKNYGLQRYADIPGISIERRTAYKREFDGLDGNIIFLTTGSTVDLAHEAQYPWIKDANAGIYRRAVNEGIPTLGPCFGLAQFARLYELPREDGFPKGKRALGRELVTIVSNHPLFNGIEQLTAYAHHNGSIPEAILERNPNTITLHATTRLADTGEIIPSVVTFGGNLAVIGTQFHREIMEDESMYLFQRTIQRQLTKIFIEAQMQMPLIMNTLQAEKNMSVEEFKQFLLDKSIQNANVSVIQQVIKTLQELGHTELKDISYANGYLQETRFTGGLSYDPLVSYLMFDNMIRLAINRYTGVASTQLGINDVIAVQNNENKKTEKLYGFVKDGSYFTAEIMGMTESEVGEMDQIYQHGFGSHLPITREEHREVAKNGDAIAIRHSNGGVVALRAMVYAAEHSVPFDRKISLHHAYQNHTVVRADYRGKGLGEELTSIAINRARARGKKVIITSVAPSNLQNIGLLTKAGYQITMFDADHFPEEEGSDRYLAELNITTPKKILPQAFYVNAFQEGRAVILGDFQISDPPTAQFIFVESEKIATTDFLLNNGYEGVRLLKGKELTGRRDDSRGFLVFQLKGS